MSGPARAANCSLQREGFAFDGMYAPGPLDPLLTSAWVVCTCLACFTTIASTWQICQHLEAGRQVTRSLYPGAKTFYTTRLLAVLPICAATSALTLFVPGLRVFFAFVQTSAVAVGLRYFGWLTAEMMGGRGRLMRDLEALPPSRWWARPPCCFVWGPMWFAWPPQRITVKSVWHYVRNAINQHSVLCPTLAFLEVAISVKRTDATREAMTITVRILATVSVMTAVWGVQSLLKICVEVANATDREGTAHSLSRILILLRVLIVMPKVFGYALGVADVQPYTLSNGAVLSPEGVRTLVDAAVFCLLQPFLACLALNAFRLPPDVHPYTSSSSAAASADELGKTEEGMVNAGLAPIDISGGGSGSGDNQQQYVVDHFATMFCPVCASDDLSLEAGLDQEAAADRNAGAGVPGVEPLERFLRCDRCSTCAIPAVIEIVRFRGDIKAADIANASPRSADNALQASSPRRASLRLGRRITSGTTSPGRPSPRTSDNDGIMLSRLDDISGDSTGAPSRSSL